MKNYYVYLHYTNEKELIYIGKGKNDRAFSHHKRNNFWKKVVNKHGLFVKFLSKNLSEEEAFCIEILAIDFFNPRCNLTQGGEGHTAPCSEKTKEGVRNMWKNMDPELKSLEQSRRSSFRKVKGIICLNNKKYYKTAKLAAEDLNIKYHQHITRVANGNRTHCQGYKFKYAT